MGLMLLHDIRKEKNLIEALQAGAAQSAPVLTTSKRYGAVVWPQLRSSDFRLVLSNGEAIGLVIGRHQPRTMAMQT